MSDIKGWFFKVKCFVIYIITEPFIQIKRSLLRLGHSTDKLAKPKVWMYIFLTFFIFASLSKNFYAAWAFLILFLLTGIKYIWDRGHFMTRYYQRKNIKREKWSKFKPPEGKVKK